MVAAHVYPSVIGPYPAIAVVPVVTVPESRDEAVDVPTTKAVVIVPGKTTTGGHVAQAQRGRAAAVPEPMSDNAAVHERVPARHSVGCEAGTDTAAAQTASAKATVAAASSAMHGQGAGWNRRHTERNRCCQCKVAQHDTSS